MDFTSSRELYHEIQKEVNFILEIFEQKSDSKELSNAIITASESFNKLKIETDQTLTELSKHTEWDALTIAFYGETNAGKSTIIDTLRILGKEKTKIFQQEEFKEIKKTYNIDSNTFENLEKIKETISNEEIKLEEEKNHFNNESEPLKISIEQLTRELKLLKNIINNYSFWRKIIALYKPLPENKKIKNLEILKIEIETELNKYNDICEEKIKKIKNNIYELTLQKENLLVGIEALKQYQDGIIIGDGQSDFTRETKSYEFEIENNKIIILDVPGIEGKEELVKDAIFQAVCKAHIVFYVTRKADPPQKGDEKTGVQGTLEKIKTHLNAQTEVWSIFNKSIKSPEALRNENLINNGEEESIKILDSAMKNQLGEMHYNGTISLSAYPAFIVSTNNFIPTSQKLKDREKFLSKNSSLEILKRTKFLDFFENVIFRLTQNAKTKILNSNYNKANETVTNLKEKIVNINKSIFVPLFKNLEDQGNNSIEQINNAINSLEKSLEFKIYEILKNKKEIIRKKVYSDIDQDLNNEEFKSLLSDHFEKEIKNLENEFPQKIKSIFNDFEEELKDIIDQFKEHTEGFLKDASINRNLKFELEIKINDGINYAGVISSIVSAAFLIFFSGGWALVLGLVGTIFSGFRAILSFFSTDYKKSQQRKTADKNLEKGFKSIEEIYFKQTIENFKKLKENIEQIKETFLNPSIQTGEIVQLLNKATNSLNKVSKNIQIQKEKYELD